MWKKNPFIQYESPPPSLPTAPAEDLGEKPSDIWVIKTKK